MIFRGLGKGVEEVMGGGKLEWGGEVVDRFVSRMGYGSPRRTTTIRETGEK